jgi:hypothetical protein
MPGLANSSRSHSRRAVRVARPAERNAPVGASGLASACLMPTGSGLDIPRLEGVRLEHQLWQGQQAAARLARTFLEADAADVDDWIAARGNPFEFLKRALVVG